MADAGANINDEYYTVDYAASLTGRSTDIIYRYIRNGVIESVQDPTDGRVRLVPHGELLKIITQPKRGLRKKTVTLTLSDGTQIKKVIPVPKEG